MDPLDRLPPRLSSRLARVTPVKRTRSRLDAPLASFSFDDFPRSAWTAGGPLLARYGARGTYYAAGRFCGAHEDGLDYYTLHDLRMIHAAGHEVGCHSFAHDRSSQVPSHALEEDFERNAEFLRRCLGECVRTDTYAYPYGDVSPRTKRLAGRRFPAARGIVAGVNAGVLELAQLKAIPLERRHWDARKIEQWVALAAEKNGWAIFFTHDVSDSPSPFGATPYMLKHALECVRSHGIEILPVREGLARATGRTPGLSAKASAQAFSSAAA